MRAGEVAVEPAPVPEPGPHQVLVEVAAVGICGSDVHYFDHGRIADFVVREPLVLGHEASGTIRAVGSEVRDRTPGQRVALEPQETCGRCKECLAGRYNLCPDVRFFATPPIHGAFAQYVVLDAIRAHPVPDSVSRRGGRPDRATVGRGLGGPQGRHRPGDRVLVTGAGPVGLLCADVARARGAAYVAVSDTNAARLAVAADRGANQTIDVSAGALEEQLEPVDVMLECSGVGPGRAAAFAVAAPAARIVLVGMGAPTSSCRSRRSSSASWWSRAPSATPTPTRPPSPWRPAGWSTWTDWSPAEVRAGAGRRGADHRQDRPEHPQAGGLPGRGPDIGRASGIPSRSTPGLIVAGAGSSPGWLTMKYAARSR